MKKISVLFIVVAMLAALLAGCNAPPQESSVPSSSAPEAVSSEPSVPSSEPSQEATPEVTPAANKGDKPDFGPLSDDLYSYQLQIGDDVYQFPMTYDDFMSFGWTFIDDDTIELGPNEYTVSERVEMGELQLYVMAINFDVNSKALNECYIGGVSVDAYQAGKSPETTFTLPKDIMFGKATAEQAKEAYGTPTYENISDSGRETLEYSGDSYEKVRMIFNEETKLLESIEVRNFTKPEDFEAGEVSTEVPAIVGKYKAPSAMSDDFGDFIVEYSGKLYQLPAPITEFEADGWVIQEDDSEMTVSGKRSGWVTLMKDNQKLRVIAQNYSEAATAINNCFITQVKGSEYSGEQISIKIPKNIEIGMSKADLEAAIAGVKFEQEDSSSYIYYDIQPTDSRVNTYEVLVSKETEKVYKIEVEYSPSFSEYTGQ